MAKAMDSATKTKKRKKTTVPKEIPLEKRRDVTIDELEKMSLPYPAELYNGKVVYKMASYEHGKIQAKITTKLNLFLEKNPLGDILIETNFRLWPDRPRESRIPDIAFVKKEHLPEDLRRFPAMAPELIVQIATPEDTFRTLSHKVDDYLAQGTQIVWLVIPGTREVLVCTSEKKYNVRDVLTAPELLPNFELPLGKIFEGLPAPARV